MLDVTVHHYKYYIGHTLGKLKWSWDKTVFYYMLDGDLKENMIIFIMILSWIDGKTLSKQGD